MPLLPRKAKKSASNDHQPSLAIAYSVKRKPKKMAEGGSVKSEKRPMPDNKYNDAKTVGKNSGNKSPHNDDLGSDVTVKQAQKPSLTRLSQPRIVGSDAFSVRNTSMRDDENDFGDRIAPETDIAQPVQRDNEDGPNRQGTKVSDMAAQHNNRKAPYNKAIEDQYAADIADANMKKVQSYAEGGRVDMEPMDNHEELIERDDEAHMESQLDPSEDEGDMDAESRNEIRPNRSGTAPHQMKMMAEGGMPEEELEHHASIAAAIMAKMKKMADGGAVDIDENNEEHPNSFYGQNEHEALDEDMDADQLDAQPEDSDEHGDSREDDEENDHDKSLVAKIMAKKRKKSAISA